VTIKAVRVQARPADAGGAVAIPRNGPLTYSEGLYGELLIGSVLIDQFPAMVSAA